MYLVLSSHFIYYRLDSERARLLNCLREVRFIFNAALRIWEYGAWQALQTL